MIEMQRDLSSNYQAIISPLPDEITFPPISNDLTHLRKANSRILRSHTTVFDRG